MKKKFAVEFLREILWEDYDKIVHSEILYKSRWSTHHEMVFSHDDTHWKVSYSEASTEEQSLLPWEGEDEVECEEVNLVPGPPIWKPVD